ncbi:MAG: D-aminoacyl-tRNA deacylase [Patescibacteria group bacterium]|nr:MAG: D-aminoacyl-tRNA deacylase [Patescibacteria group bacterium]
MRAVVQRVKWAKVEVNKQTVSEIGKGLLVLLGIRKNDTADKAKKMAEKLVKLRIFEDEANKMSKSLTDVKGQILLVSQFTLIADTKKGNRPSFIQAEEPEKAKKIYKLVVNELSSKVVVKTGVFGQYMQVSLQNDGPVTIILDI